MYMTPEQARERLSARYGITDTPLLGDVIAASEDLREMGPFNKDVDIEEPPDSLLDWVALRAHVLSEDEPGAVTKASMTPFSRTYARPEKTRNGKRLEALVAPYLRRTGRVA